MITDKSDNELMEEFSRCSMDSFIIIFNRYKNRILNFVLRGYLHDKDDAEDIVQKTLIKVYQYKYKYSPTNQFSTWAYTIAKNLALNELKRKSRSNSSYDDKDNVNAFEEGQSPSQLIERNNINNLLLNIIESLKPQYREVIVMRYLEGFNYQEISKITSLRINTLKSHSKRALKQIYDKLKNHGIEKE